MIKVMFLLLALFSLLLYAAFGKMATAHRYAALVPPYQSDCRSAGVLTQALLTDPNTDPPPCYRLLVTRKVLKQKRGGGRKHPFTYAVYFLEPPSFSSAVPRWVYSRVNNDAIGGSVPLTQAVNWDTLPGREELSADHLQSVKTVSCDVEVWRRNGAILTSTNGAGTASPPWSRNEDRRYQVTRIRAAGQDIEAQNNPSYQSRSAAFAADQVFGMAIAIGLAAILVPLVRLLPLRARSVLWVIYAVCCLAYLAGTSLYSDTHFGRG